MNVLNDKNKMGNFLLLAFSAFYIINISAIADDPTQLNTIFTAKTLPLILSILSISICILKLILKNDKEESISESVKNYRWKLMISLLVLMLLYSLLFSWLGFIFSTFLFLFIGFLILGEKRYLKAAFIAFMIDGFMWSVLSLGFELQLELGDIFYLLLGKIS